MPTKEELIDMVNKGVDQMFPFRRLARMAFTTQAAAPLMNLRNQNPQQFDSEIENADKENKNLVENFKFHNRNAMRGAVGLPKAQAGNFDMDKMGINEGEFGGRKAPSKSAGLPPITNSNDVFKKGGKVKASSASKRADGIAQKGKTRGRLL